MTAVLFSIGPVRIYTASFFLSLAFLSATFIIWREGRRKSFEEEKLLDLVLLSTIGGILIGRVLFIALHTGLFHSVSEYIEFWKVGGISFFGAVIGAVLMAFWQIKRNHWPEAMLFDIVALGMFFGLAVYKVGIFLSGAGFGIKNNSFLGVRFLGIAEKRMPVSLFEAIFFSVLFVIFLLFLRKGKLKKGRIFGFGVICIGIGLSLFYLLDDHSLMVNPALTLLSRLAIIMVGFGFIYVFSQRKLKEDLRIVTGKIQSMVTLKIKTRKGHG